MHIIPKSVGWQIALVILNFFVNFQYSFKKYDPSLKGIQLLMIESFRRIKMTFGSFSQKKIDWVEAVTNLSEYLCL